MKFNTPSFLHKQGIVLSKEAVPYDSALVFNAGVARYSGGYVMLFRNDYGFRREDFDDFYAGISDNTVPKTNIGVAYSRDGIRWEVGPTPVFSFEDSEISRAYDPRITAFGNGEYGVCFALDSAHGTRGGIAMTRDFRHFEVKTISVPENRNMVLFPEKIHGQYMRLERPFTCGLKQNYSIWISSSSNLIHWGESKLLLSAEKVPFANSKIGPAAPPVKTPYGWLTLFHAVEDCPVPFRAWSRNWCSRYYGGAMLLDSDDPSHILAMAGEPLLVPETEYELDGFRGEVIFPGGLLAEADGSVKIYYGAADTVECLSTAKMDDLIQFIQQTDIKKGEKKCGTRKRFTSTGAAISL